MNPPATPPTRNDPGQGPRILFFSGGSALGDLSRRLVSATWNSAHVITPFDSGGSSAPLRRAFAMAAPGDLRNRLMALADRGHAGNPEVLELFDHRFPKVADAKGLDAELAEMASGAHPLVSVIPDPMRSAVRAHLDAFMQLMPRDFDLRGACIGNLILTAGYVLAGRSFSKALESFRSLAQVRGQVVPVCEEHLHLAAELEDGAVVCAQHRMTAKETAPLAAPIQRLWICRGEDDPTPAPCAAGRAALDLVARAELICFPLGSFHTSVVANLLPAGVGRAVAANPCPKVFIPNPGRDPECSGSVARQAEILVRTLASDARDGGARAPGGAARPYLDRVLVDERAGTYPGGLDAEALRAMGLDILDRRLITDRSAPLMDARRLADELLRLARP